MGRKRKPFVPCGEIMNHARPLGRDGKRPSHRVDPPIERGLHFRSDHLQKFLCARWA